MQTIKLKYIFKEKYYVKIILSRFYNLQSLDYYYLCFTFQIALQKV